MPAWWLACCVAVGGLHDKKPPGGALSAYRSLVSCNFLFGVVCAWRGVAGFKVASSPRVVREKVRPARHALAVNAKKFAQHAQNALHSLFLRPLGEFFRENAAGVPLLGEFFRESAACVPLLGELCRARGRMCLVLGACFRAQGAGVFFYVTGVFFCVTGVLRWFQSDCDTGIFVHVAATRTCSSA